MLQGALADVQQPAHIAVVQPVRVLTLSLRMPCDSIPQGSKFHLEALPNWFL